jgi:hypothetical protein
MVNTKIKMEMEMMRLGPWKIGREIGIMEDWLGDRDQYTANNASITREAVLVEKAFYPDWKAIIAGKASMHGLEGLGVIISTSDRI